MAVYRDYDQAGLDAQYNLRSRHPECLAMFEGWRRRSAQVRAARRCAPGLVYDDASGEALDLFPVDAPPPAGSPLVMFVHGGYWQALDKDHFGYLAPPFLDRGIAFASIDYTLAPRAGMDEIVRQTRSAVSWLRRHAGGYGIDPDRIIACGHSAGGHLASMLAAEGPSGEPSSPALAGVCSISGLYDLEPIRLCYLNGTLGLDAATARRNSPVHLAPAKATPVSCAVGGAETEEFLRQQRAFADVWQAAGATVGTVEMPGCDHFTIMDAMARPETALFQAIAGLANGR